MENLNKALTIGKFTFKEIIKSKILMNIIFLGLGMFVMTYVAYSFTYGEPARIALDFGLGTLSLSCVGIAIFIGSGILSKEIESRTVYMIISRPVPRFCFILGKVLGLAGVLFINVLLLSVIIMSLYFIIGGEYSPLIAWSVLFIFLESLIVLLVVSALSLVSSQTISVILSMLIYVLGHAVEGIKNFHSVASNPLLSKIVEGYQFVLPAYYKLNIKQFVLYEQNLELSFLMSNIFYSIAYSAFLIMISIVTFNRKNLD